MVVLVVTALGGIGWIAGPMRSRETGKKPRGKGEELETGMDTKRKTIPISSSCLLKGSPAPLMTLYSLHACLRCRSPFPLQVGLSERRRERVRLIKKPSLSVCRRLHLDTPTTVALSPHASLACDRVGVVREEQARDLRALRAVEGVHEEV